MHFQEFEGALQYLYTRGCLMMEGKGLVLRDLELRSFSLGGKNIFRWVNITLNTLNTTLNIR